MGVMDKRNKKNIIRGSWNSGIKLVESRERTYAKLRQKEVIQKCWLKASKGRL